MKKVKIQNVPFGPFPTMLVGADVKGRPNYATVGACGVVSLKPVLYISLKSTHYTTLGVKENGFFSVNIPPADLVQKTDYCGIVSGHRVDKSNIFTQFYDELGKAPMISECSMNILCKVIQNIPMFDFDFFLGEIVAVYINEQCLTNGKPDPLKINPIIMIGGSYCDLGQVVGTAFKEGSVYKK
jgi:flavin reductase (DIM6/NTAB) family NADH-FMN oxidoreductase RutF